MDIKTYRERRELLKQQEPKFRTRCWACTQPEFSCFCKHVERFNSNIDFVILIHPLEVRRRIATGRMSHLCLENSFLLKGQDFSENEVIDRLLADQTRHCVVLYPGKSSVNLTDLEIPERQSIFPATKKLTIFVIDGTWTTARKMIRSHNLINLPRICFTPVKPSNFRVRKQPAAFCLSTIEAIHHTIELIGESQGLDVSQRPHDKLLKVFDSMVELQLDFINRSSSKTTSWRALAHRKAKEAQQAEKAAKIKEKKSLRL
ncbi:MAG: tRNA-uridine aminocarboxypropyltransferase [Bdellovibrionota bacterium]|mgnify:CR=1 FL=1